MAPRNDVKCVSCLATVDWPTDDRYLRFADGAYHPASLRGLHDPAVRIDAERALYRSCPNPQGFPEHHLPARYYSYGPPLAIGLVGDSSSGKTHLLAAMVAALLADGAVPGLGVSVLDHRRHLEFRRRNIDVLFGTDERPESRELDGTGTGRWEPEVVLLLTPAHGPPRPLSVFDVAGGDLAEGDARLLDPEGSDGASGEVRPGAMLLGVDALLFVQPLGDPVAHGPRQPVIAQALNRLDAVAGYRQRPAAVALTKCDRLRYEPVVDRWLRAPRDPRPSAVRIRAESADAYALLHERGHAAAMRPAALFARCTLHLVSATGREARDKRFARGVAPLRVLEPLTALFAMAGVLPADGEVGR